MADDALVQAHIDPDINARATEVLAMMGLTVSEAVRRLLTYVATGGATPFELATNREEFAGWVRAKVQEALDDPRPGYSEEEADAIFDKWRTEARRRIEGGGA